MLLSRHTQGRSQKYYQMLKKAGWQAVDMNETADKNMFLQSAEEREKYVEQALEYIEQAGLKVGQCHAPMPHCIVGKTEQEVNDILLSIMNCIETASKFNIPYVVVHPFIYDWATDDPEPEKTLQFNLEYLKKAVEKAKGTIVCLENMPGFRGITAYPENVKYFIDNVPGLCACLDTGHAVCNGLKTSDFFKVLGDKIKCLHVHDSIAGTDLHALPYSNQVDWQDFKQTIKEYNYQGNINSESNFSFKLPNENRLEWETFEAKVYKTLME